MIYHLDDAEKLADEFAALLPTAALREQVCKTLLRRAATDDPLVQRFLIGLASQHPRADEKFGTGVLEVTIRKASYGTKCFYLNRADGTGTDFSYIKAVSPPAPKNDVDAACRIAIQGQIDAYRSMRLHGRNPTCDVTGVPLFDNNAHVHHAPPMFAALLNQWVAASGGWEQVAGRMIHHDNQHGAQLAPDDLQSWRDWHQTNANLQLVHADVNGQIEQMRRRLS